MSNGSQFGNCSSLTTDQLLSVNLAFSVSGGMCWFTLSLITLLLLLSKSYHTVLQRLLLYHMIATALDEFFIFASIEHQTEYTGQETVCTWIGFLFNWAIFLRVVTTIGIMVYLVALVWNLARGNTVPQFLQSKRRRVVLEVSYVVISPIFCLAYASVPFFTGNYGLAGAWCWVQSQDENCEFSESGFIGQVVHSYSFSMVNSTVAVILMVAIAVVYCRLSSTLLELRSLVKKTFFVTVCFFLHMLCVTVAFIYRMMERHHQSLAPWYSAAISYPFGMLLFPIAFVISFYPVQKLCGCKRCAKALKCSNCCKKKTSNKHTTPHRKQPAFSTCNTAPTVPESTRESLPSHTFFEVPYTGGFTNIRSDTTPLVTDTADTGYGSQNGNGTGGFRTII